MVIIVGVIVGVGVADGGFGGSETVGIEVGLLVASGTFSVFVGERTIETDGWSVAGPVGASVLAELQELRRMITMATQSHICRIPIFLM